MTNTSKIERDKRFDDIWNERGDIDLTKQEIKDFLDAELTRARKEWVEEVVYKISKLEWVSHRGGNYKREGSIGTPTNIDYIEGQNRMLDDVLSLLQDMSKEV